MRIWAQVLLPAIRYACFSPVPVRMRLDVTDPSHTVPTGSAGELRSGNSDSDSDDGCLHDVGTTLDVALDSALDCRARSDTIVRGFLQLCRVDDIATFLSVRQDEIFALVPVCLGRPYARMHLADDADHDVERASCAFLRAAFAGADWACATQQRHSLGSACTWCGRPTANL